MNSTRPYLIRAFYEWIVDNQLTPYLLVNTEIKGVEVPEQYIEEGKIILNISPNAIQDLQISNHWVEFDASFGGQPLQVTIPVLAVLAIYARENGRGMVFNVEEGDVGGGDDETMLAPPPPPRRLAKAKLAGKPKLTVIK